MRKNFSELYWAIILSFITAFLATFKFIRNFAQEIFEEKFLPLDANPNRINWTYWLITLFVLLVLLMILTIFLWRHQLKITKLKARSTAFTTEKNKPQKHN